MLTLCLGVQCPDQPCDTNQDCVDQGVGGICVEGECVECAEDADCLDTTVCNGAETCGDDFNCVAGTDLDCDDNDACTTDSCNATTGCSSVPTAVAAGCDDGLYCTGVESCNTTTGACVDGVDPCAAGQVCLEPTDICTAACTSSATCNDNNVCTVDTCTSGACLYTAVSCDDSNACTTDTCGPTTGCASTPIVCPTGQTCDTTTGLCGSGCASNTDCNDSNTCTDDTCNNSICANDPVDCPQGEICNPANGNCENIDCTTNAQCDDGASCTTDTCQVGTGNCVYTNIDAACDNGLHCDGTEGAGSCDPDDPDAEDGTGCNRPGNPCGGTTPVCNEAQDDCDACNDDGDCDDERSCTTDNCEANGSCTNTRVDSRCDDNKFCTADDRCDPDDDDASDVTGCVNDTDPCNCNFPSNPCGFAVAGGFIQRKICSEANNGECNDCTANSQCSDNIACTADTCNGTNGVCENVDDDDLCSDPDFCDGVDFCDPDDEDADSNGCVNPGNPCNNNFPICDETGNDCEACTSNTECDDWVGRDDINCTDTTCNGVTGACSNTANNGNCPVGQVCNPAVGCQ